ncbi:MAG: OB-fold nucleic acid binding domain-containing protein, partial [Oliverpabstia sp.]|nr:OB-fold nucleic acid binding domain-containing protein [Oliverpabstia sp.]
MMQDQEIFSFFEVRNVPQELRTKAQTLLVKNVDYYQKAQRLDVFVSADHMIDSPGLTEAEKLIADQAFPSHDILVRIIPRFMLNPVPTALEILEQYKDNIAWELEHKKKDIPMRMLYKGSYAEETSKGIVLRTKDKFMAEIAGQKLIDYLKEILLMRFGLDTCVFLEVCEDPKFIQAQLFNHEQERLRILNEYRTAVPTGQKADTAKTTPKKPESLLLYGKNTDGAITRLDELDDIKGNIVVRGRILSSEVRKTKQEEKKLLILSLTDDTDSIAAKLFLKAEIADKLSAQLQEGTCVKIKGVAGFDPYSQERSITTVFGISTIEEFAVKRNDSAKRKRVELH